MEKKMFLKASNLIFENAKELRKNLTHAELILWGYLKQRPQGHKFRRQHPISNYIADFYAHSLKLIIEVDGSVHADEIVFLNDIERQSDLEKKGISFLRFTNEEVETSLEIVVSKIEEYIKSYQLQNEGKPL